MIYLRILTVDWKHALCLISNFSWDVEMIILFLWCGLRNLKKKEFIFHSLLNIDKYVKQMNNVLPFLGPVNSSPF